MRHTIDDTSRGADGVRLADVNGDGWPDIATAWEEGGQVHVAVHPGPAAVRGRWPTVTVGQVGSPEDAVLVDLDEDGAVDVVSSSEGRARTVWIHWAPREGAKRLNPLAWETQAIGASVEAHQWMFSLPMQVDGENGVDLIAGAKGEDAQIGWFRAPNDPRDTHTWQWFPIDRAGWIMSLAAMDVDRDGDLDVIVSDRKGERRSVRWLENPGPGPAQRFPWSSHLMGAADKEVMFLAVHDLDGDGWEDVVVATSGRELVYLRRSGPEPDRWEGYPIELPESAGTAKAVAVGDIDLDGRLDIVVSCENAGDKLGVMWLSYRNAVTDRRWTAHDISGLEGAKFDLVVLRDLDADGDLDVITCEEQENLGVIWYENVSFR